MSVFCARTTIPAVPGGRRRQKSTKWDYKGPEGTPFPRPLGMQYKPRTQSPNTNSRPKVIHHRHPLSATSDWPARVVPQFEHRSQDGQVPFQTQWLQLYMWAVFRWWLVRGEFPRVLRAHFDFSYYRARKPPSPSIEHDRPLGPEMSVYLPSQG